jgi:hypothetical protein
MKPLRAVIAVLALAGSTATPSFADDAKADACEAAPTHACVLDLMWDHMPRVTRNFQAETKRAFLDAAFLSGDQALIDEYLRRTEWANTAAIDDIRIGIARRTGDHALLVHHADRVISGVTYDWYTVRNLAVGLAEAGDIDRARKLADLIPHGPDDSVTWLNLRTHALEVISFNDPRPVSLRTWADRSATDPAWWEDADQAWLKAATARAGNLDTFQPELQARYRADGWKYLRAIAYLAPQMTASGNEQAVTLFRSYIEDWADPRNDNIADFVLMIAARVHPDVRAAMLAAFDARQPSPPPRIARIRALAIDPDAPLDAAGKGLLGLTGGSYEQQRAAEAFATLSREQFLLQAKSGEGPFSLSRPAVLRAALSQAPDDGYALAIAQLMAELGIPRTIDGYDYAQYATEWALKTCNAALYKTAESRLARSDTPDVMMQGARFDRNPVDIVRFVTYGDGPINSSIASALRGYETIIADGYCPAN